MGTGHLHDITGRHAGVSVKGVAGWASSPPPHCSPPMSSISPSAAFGPDGTRGLARKGPLIPISKFAERRQVTVNDIAHRAWAAPMSATPDQDGREQTNSLAALQRPLAVRGGLSRRMLDEFRDRRSESSCRSSSSTPAPAARPRPPCAKVPNGTPTRNPMTVDGFGGAGRDGGDAAGRGAAASAPMSPAPAA